jgi:hypothetical protein
LDDSHRDLGLSGFRGIHRHKGALGAFLRKVETGEIARGSTLIVENLDRLTREDVVTAVSLFIQIIDAGITVVTLSDERGYSRESILRDPTEFTMSIAAFIRGNAQSVRNGEMLAEVWEEKRRTASKKLTSVGPFWLTLPGTTPDERLSAEWEASVLRVRHVKLAFRLARKHGKEVITQAFNRKRIPGPTLARIRVSRSVKSVDVAVGPRTATAAMVPLMRAPGAAA